VLIDYQPEQYRTVTSSTPEEVSLNVIALCKLARAYGVPVVVSTVWTWASTPAPQRRSWPNCPA